MDKNPLQLNAIKRCQPLHPHSLVWGGLRTCFEQAACGSPKASILRPRGHCRGSGSRLPEGILKRSSVSFVITLLSYTEQSTFRKTEVGRNTRRNWRARSTAQGRWNWTQQPPGPHSPSGATSGTPTLAPTPTASCLCLKDQPPRADSSFFPSQGTSLSFQMASLVSTGQSLPISGGLESSPAGATHLNGDSGHVELSTLGSLSCRPTL